MKLFKQPKNSMLCGPYSLKMVLSYHGKTPSIKSILKDAPLYKEGTYIGDLGFCAIMNGFNAKIVLFDTSIMAPEYAKMSIKKMVEEMKKRKSMDKEEKKGLKAIIKFLKAGGKIEVRIIKMEEIKDAIKNKVPPILCIDRKILYGKGPGKKGHFVVASGFKRKKILLNDPHSRYGGIKDYDKEEILFALYSHGGKTLFISPK